MVIGAVYGGGMFHRWAPQLLLLWDLIIATVVATVAVQYRDYSVWDVVIGVGMAAALIARRYAPIRVFAVVTVLCAVQLVAASAIPAGYDVALLVAMLAVVTHSPDQGAVYLSGLVVAAGALVATAVQIETEWPGSILDYPYLAEQAVILAVSGALWLVAYVLRTNRERGLVLTERAATAERERDQLARLAAADERAFIARELHDVVAHSLAVMIAQADGARYVLDTDAERAREAMCTVAGTGREALDDMHRIVAVLRGTGGEEDPEDRRRRGLGQLGTVVQRARAAGLDVASRIDGDVERLSAAEELTVFRIAQESLTNALRHAGPGTRVTVGLVVEPSRAVLEVRDDGTGEAPTATGGGNGLIGMRERVAVHGGELSAGPAPDGGWLVRAMIPIKEDS
ncbi:two-component sensor histidine kinase [Actinoplanes italicus]|uniref:histidine kinase n=2 Tax=Actinoplanes italicus TaxID=113567 RepID=A0A2T0K5R6_9ACTN|nr:signal transduction histidine kinase [Actinoplanes italicus]GIE32697.1 two-component sensor histidine kinase [Actinoplanes italicus]